jgi:DNA anti-recombination protein RmuC
VEALQREHRITLAGPTTLLATLTSLQMGFRTLALEQRSAEVWEVLGAVKTEFAKFGDVLAKTKKKLDEASKTLDAAEVRTRAMARSLRGVEALPDERAQVLLAGPTTLLATLNSLQMGFRTLALEKRSAEVWEVLGAVKTEFASFSAVLAKTRKKLDEAANTIDLAQTRSNVMARRLKSVEAVPEARARSLLPELADDDDEIEVATALPLPGFEA